MGVKNEKAVFRYYLKNTSYLYIEAHGTSYIYDGLETGAVALTNFERYYPSMEAGSPTALSGLKFAYFSCCDLAKPLGNDTDSFVHQIRELGAKNVLGYSDMIQSEKYNAEISFFNRLPTVWTDTCIYSNYSYICAELISEYNSGNNHKFVAELTQN